MASSAKGWTLERDPRNGIYRVRFRHAGRRFKRSTRTSDRSAAQKEAARIFAEEVEGQRRRARGRAFAGVDLIDLASEWLAALEAGGDVRESTRDLFEIYITAHWVRIFRDAVELGRPCASSRRSTPTSATRSCCA